MRTRGTNIKWARRVGRIESVEPVFHFDCYHPSTCRLLNRSIGRFNIEHWRNYEKSNPAPVL
jgi:hypothetical protein